MGLMYKLNRAVKLQVEYCYPESDCCAFLFRTILVSGWIYFRAELCELKGESLHMTFQDEIH